MSAGLDGVALEISREMPEVTEGNSQGRGRGPRLRAETDHLGLALAAVAAVGEFVIAVAWMGHELGHPAGQAPEDGDGAGGRPVGPGAGLAKEMVGSGHAERARGATGLISLAPPRD